MQRSLAAWRESRTGKAGTWKNIHERGEKRNGHVKNMLRVCFGGSARLAFTQETEASWPRHQLSRGSRQKRWKLVEGEDEQTEEDVDGCEDKRNMTSGSEETREMLVRLKGLLGDKQPNSITSSPTECMTHVRGSAANRSMSSPLLCYLEESAEKETKKPVRAILALILCDESPSSLDQQSHKAHFSRSAEDGLLQEKESGQDLSKVQ